MFATDVLDVSEKTSVCALGVNVCIDGGQPHSDHAGAGATACDSPTYPIRIRALCVVDLGIDASKVCSLNCRAGWTAPLLLERASGRISQLILSYNIQSFHVRKESVGTSPSCGQTTKVRILSLLVYGSMSHMFEADKRRRPSLQN
jgi:hypothetical protein